MKLSTILDHIDSGHIALPEFQRGYVWNRDQVRELVRSLYLRHPVGNLLVWAIESEHAQARGDGQLAPGVVKLLLDGQQRVTSLYGITRGMPPKFFDGNAQAFTNLRFHVENQEFAFYSPVKMKDDPLWIDVTELMKAGNNGFGVLIDKFNSIPELKPKVGIYMGRINDVLGIRDVDFHIAEVTGKDKTIDVVVDIFNRVNSGGTKLSKGDLALAKICAEAPDARERMKKIIEQWREVDYQFDLDWLLRNINTVIKGEAKFNALHDVDASEFSDGLKRAEKVLNTLLNTIGSRLGLDHDRVFFGRYAMPVMAHYLDRKDGQFKDEKERHRLLFWYLQCAMWGRYSGSTESTIDKDLRAIQDKDRGLEGLIKELLLWRGNLKVLPDHFGGWSLGARFYPVLYLLTRTGEARDWGTRIPLKHGLLGKMSKLEVHHIFPKAQLRKLDYHKTSINAVANYCFLTKDTNLRISARRPEEYFPEIEDKHPGALASQWIPMDHELWKLDNYEDFLQARRELLAEGINGFLISLLHGEEELLEGDIPVSIRPNEVTVTPSVLGSIDSEQEDEMLKECNRWVVEKGLPEGCLTHELVDEQTGEPKAILDLAWPDGLQPGFSQPVAVLINEGNELLTIANAAGYRYFNDVDSFKHYVLTEVQTDV